MGRVGRPQAWAPAGAGWQEWADAGGWDGVKSGFIFPIPLRHKNGSVQNVLIASSVLFDDAGNFVHTRCFTVLAPASSGG
jgi:hypothetical protein